VIQIENIEDVLKYKIETISKNRKSTSATKKNPSLPVLRW